MNAVVPKGDSNANVERRENKRRFPRSVRLLRHADFERVYKQGRRHFSASMTIFYVPRQEAPGPGSSSHDARGVRIGFTVGRALGGAVQRNRMKRRLREAVRLCRPATLPDVDIVINPKKSLLTTKFCAVQDEVAKAFVIIEQKVGSKSIAANLTEQSGLAGARRPKHA